MKAFLISAVTTAIVAIVVIAIVFRVAPVRKAVVGA